MRGRAFLFSAPFAPTFPASEPIGSALPGDRIRLASLGPEVGSDARPLDRTCSTEPLASARRSASVNEPPASFDKRFASVDDYPASTDGNLGSAMRQLVISMRSPADQDVETATRPADQLGLRAAGSRRGGTDFSIGRGDRCVAADSSASTEQPGKDSDPPADDDSRTAIYDIAARAVYMPSGRKLEAHSGIGSLMDNPRHVRVRMRGASAAECLQALVARAVVSWSARPAPRSPRRAQDVRSRRHAGPFLLASREGPVARMRGLQQLSRVPERLPQRRGHPPRRGRAS